VRAAVFDGPGLPLRIEERPEPTPGPGQVLLRVGRSGICGSDVHMTSGGLFGFPPGVVLGHEYAGEVVELGPGVEALKVGDRVAPLPGGGCGTCSDCLDGTPYFCTGVKPPMRLGGYAEYAIADESGSTLLPPQLTDADGALVEPLAVSLHGVLLSGLERGHSVVVQGAGPIAVAAVYWLRQLGAGRITVVARSRRRERFVAAVGADELVESGEDAVDSVLAAVGRRPDIVVEAAGYPGTISDAIKIVKPRGTVVVLGNLTEPDTFEPWTALLKQVRLQFAIVYGMREFQQTVATLAAGATEPRAMVTSTVSFSELPTVFESLRDTNDECKVLIDPALR